MSPSGHNSWTLPVKVGSYPLYSKKRVASTKRRKSCPEMEVKVGEIVETMEHKRIEIATQRSHLRNKNFLESIHTQAISMNVNIAPPRIKGTRGPGQNDDPQISREEEIELSHPLHRRLQRYQDRSRLIDTAEQFSFNGVSSPSLNYSSLFPIKVFRVEGELGHKHQGHPRKAKFETSNLEKISK
ncbi:hypothetical protein Tco_0186319 [Tanacetum coccineum]